MLQSKQYPDAFNHEAQAPTCTAIGWDEYDTCSRCDYTTYVEIPAKGHTEVTDVAVPATCTETGLTAGLHCSVCNEVLVVPEIVPAKGHDWNAAEYEWSADKASITAIHICKNDKTHSETETVNVTAVIISPAEDTEGSATYTSNEFTKEGFSIQTKSIAIPALRDMSVMRLPNMLDTIENEAFSNLACQVIIIPDNCTTIGEYAFAECTNLLYVKIPASVKSYPANACEGCNANLVIDWTKE